MSTMQLAAVYEQRLASQEKAHQAVVAAKDEVIAAKDALIAEQRERIGLLSERVAELMARTAEPTEALRQMTDPPADPYANSEPPPTPEAPFRPAGDTPSDDGSTQSKSPAHPFHETGSGDVVRGGSRVRPWQDGLDKEAGTAPGQGEHHAHTPEGQAFVGQAVEKTIKEPKRPGWWARLFGGG